MTENESSLKENILDETIITSENIVGLVHWLVKFRVRLITIVLVPLAFSIAVYFFSDPILKLISLPLKGQTLFFITPVDGIMAKIKVALFGGIIAAFPVIAYLITSLFIPRLNKTTGKKVYFLIIPFASISFVGGVVFAYKLILPTTVEFLIRCGSDVLKPMISGSDYVSFITFFLVSVGFVFELPLVLVALSRVGMISSRTLRNKRKIAIVVTLIVLAILTPTPDAFTLLAASLPVLFLYELSVWWIFMLERIDGKKEKSG